MEKGDAGVVRGWAAERFDLLQPDGPSAHIMLIFLGIEQIKDVSKKELALMGLSSGSRTAAGGLDFTKRGMEPVAGAKEVET